MITRHHTCLALGVVVLASILTTDGYGQESLFVNSKFNYQLAIPNEWSKRADPATDVLTLFNYPANQAGPQGLFPESGAEIYLIPARARGTNPRTVDKWIQHDLALAGHPNVLLRPVAPVASQPDVPQDIMQLTMTVAMAGGEVQEVKSYYFTLRGEMFQLTLTYWQGNPASKDLLATLDYILHSVRST